MNSENTNRTLSPEDELYKRLTGKVFTKAGTAYERISTAVAKIILNADKARHNVFKTGISEVTHQLDGVLDSDIMLEAKDYSIRNAKVGLEEVRNHQGAMLDIDGINKGFFASATDYTSEASKYVAGSFKNPRLANTHAAVIRHSTPEDEECRIKTIVLNISMPYLDYDRGKYALILSDDAETKRFNEFIATQDGQSLRIYDFFDEKGNLIKSMSELSQEQIPDNWPEQTIIKGQFQIDAYIKAGDEQFHIKGIQYEVEVKTLTETATIEANGEACCLVKCPSLGIDKLITDTDLRTALRDLG